MTNKAFEIQSSSLRIGGIELEAGATSIVIPGVTQAANYRVEEINERDGNNPDVFGSDENAVTIIDNAEYVYQSGGAQPSGAYETAGYSANELDDGEIDEVNVEVQGVFSADDKTRAEAANMWATTVADPLVSFDAGDWTQIPFRPSFRADTVENVGTGTPYLELTNDALIALPTTLGSSVTVTAAPAGSGAAFEVVILEGPVLDSVTATTPGTNYVVGQRYKIGYGQIGGSTDSSSLIFTIDTVDEGGEILTVANTVFVGTPDNTPGSYGGQNADYIPSVFDVIDTGLTLTRDNQRALFNIEEETQYDNNLDNSPLGTSWNSDGWGDLTDLVSRKYTTLYESLDGAIGNNIIDAELVMHDTINDKFYKFNFSAWGQSNAGGFSYVRNLINQPNYFAKTDYGNEVDIFVEDDGDGAGIGITRGNNGGIYNPYRDGGWDNDISPDGTLWNIDGWNDLSNIETRTYQTFYEAYGGNALGNRVPGSQSIMYIPETEEYYAIQWINWTQNNVGGGFSYIRKKIDLTKINEGIRFADGTVLKSASDIVGRVKSTASRRRRIEEVYGEKTVYLAQAVTTNLTTVSSRAVTSGSRIFIGTSGTTIDDILNSPGTYSITDTNTIQFSVDNNNWYAWDGTMNYPDEGEISYGLRGLPSLTYSDGDTIYFRYKTGGAPVVWWDKTDLPSGGGDFRGAIIDYHAYTGDATWIGTIHIVDDDGEENITHTEVSSGSTDAENDDLWLVQNEGTISYRRIDGESATLKVHWSAKVFYGSEYYD